MGTSQERDQSQDQDDDVTETYYDYDAPVEDPIFSSPAFASFRIPMIMGLPESASDYQDRMTAPPAIQQRSQSVSTRRTPTHMPTVNIIEDDIPSEVTTLTSPSLLKLSSSQQ